MASNEVISKAEAARRWGVSKAAVTKYVKRGLPTRGDGRLDWPLVDSWRKRYVGFEPMSPRAAREAKTNRAKPIEQSAEDEAREEAIQEGRWQVFRMLTGPAAMERTVKVLRKLGFTPKHALQAAYWFYLSPAECDDTNERDLDGPGAIFEPDWNTMLPADKPLDVERVTVCIEMAATELFHPELIA